MIFHTIEGNSRDIERVYSEWVAEAEDGDTIVEVGVWKGRSLAMLCEMAKVAGKRLRIVGMDLFEDAAEIVRGAPIAYEPATEWEARQNVAAAGYPVEILRRASDSTMACDYVFIDADHSYEGAARDIARWRTHARKAIAGHDYEPSYPGVVRAVDEAFPDAEKRGICWVNRLAPKRAEPEAEAYAGPVSFAFSVAHAGHVPERKPGLDRLLAALPSGAHVESAPGKPHEWSERQWKGAIAQGRTHCALLNDDVIPCDGFLDVLDAAVRAQPKAILNLYNLHPLAAEADARGFRWLTSPDGLIGNAYVLPTSTLEEFLVWRSLVLKPGAVEELSEDQLVNMFAMTTERLIWHTVPSLVDHDPQIASLFPKNMQHRASVGPRPGMPRDWRSDALHTGRFFLGNHWALLTHTRPEAWRELGLVERAYKLHTDVDPMWTWRKSA